MTKKAILNLAAVLAAVCALTPVAALAPALPAIDAGTMIPVVNGAIDQAQPSLADWISTTFDATLSVFLIWLGRKVGIKLIEKLNRDAIRTASRNFANFVVDELQARFLRAGPQADISDLVERGLDYVRGGSKDAIKEKKVEAERLRKQVEGALREKAADLLAKKLREAGVLDVYV